MQNYKKLLFGKLFTISFIIMLAIIIGIITILFNFKGNFGLSAVNDRVAVAKQEINQKQIGYISRVYEKEGKRYLSFDEVKFLVGEEAVEAAKKDGKAIFENGKYSVLDDYYIVKENKGIKDYVINDYAVLNLLGFMVTTDNNNISNEAIDYEKFKATINNKKYPILCHIYLQGNIVIKVDGQYVP